jgi:serine/threonine-protein kinase
MVRLFLVAAVTGLMAISSAAQTPADLAVSARKILKKHCLTCHSGEGSSSGYLFDVLNHKSLVTDQADEKAVVVAGKLDSRLWVRAGVEKTMPPKAVKERPTAEELEIVKKWIEAGAPAYPEPKERTFITHGAVLKMVYDHLNNAPADDQPFLRYFTLTNAHNNPNAGEEDLRILKAALSKAMNSMTRSPRVTLPKPIDKDETVYVIDLRDFEWHRNGIWTAILREYPYGLDFKGSDDPALIELQKKLDRLTRGELFYIRADWFISTATKPPLYHTLLQLPDTVEALRTWLKVDFKANFRANTLKRAGYQTSGISAQNRMVERHDSPVGNYYWESYDFKPRKAKTNLTRFPLGPAFAGNDFPRQAFDHDGGEMIFGLPNGLQGYYLADGKGKRINEGPLDVVSDSLKTSGSPAIVTGMSCMNCHKYGMIGFTDTIRDGNALFGDAREKVLKLYPEKGVLEALWKADEDRFLGGLEKAVGPFLKVGEDARRPIRDFGEVIGEVTRGYLLADLTPDKAAQELGIPKGDILAGMIRGNQQLKIIGMLPLANGKPLRRDDWEAPDGTSLYQDVARALGIGTPNNTK